MAEGDINCAKCHKALFWVSKRWNSYHLECKACGNVIDLPNLKG